jgi:NADH:ubiquinone oxidoreductase subunit D
VGQHGDCYDRFLIRMCEMSESLNIVNQIIFKILKYKPSSGFSKVHQILNYSSIGFTTKLKTHYTSMEGVINHFKFWSEGFSIKPNWSYSAVESAKGEFGVSLFSDGTNTPYRCKVRSPAFHNLHALPQITKGHFLADLVALIGTIDVVFGEVDR